MPISVRWLAVSRAASRPVLIVQNNVGNRYSPTVIAAAITSQINKAKMPTHITVGAPNYGLTKDSIILTEQIRTLDKRRLRGENGDRSTKKPCGTLMKHWRSVSDSARCRGKPYNGGEKAHILFIGYALFAYRLGFAICGRLFCARQRVPHCNRRRNLWAA